MPVDVSSLFVERVRDFGEVYLALWRRLGLHALARTHRRGPRNRLLGTRRVYPHHRAVTRATRATGPKCNPARK